MLSRLGRVKLAIDVGGNWGQSIWALKRTARPERIASFEPDADLARRLERQFAHDSTVAIERFALSDRDGSFKLYTPRYRNFVYDGLASLDYAEAEGWLRDRMAGFDRRLLTVVEQSVPVRTLDSFELSPEVIKIDVQGAEYKVVLGGIETFSRADPVAIIEAPSAELVGLLASIGMHAYRYAEGRLHDDWQGSTNVVFVSTTRRRQLAL